MKDNRLSGFELPDRARVLFIGAHPDDCEISCGGTAALLTRRGHEVTFLSVTNGQSGHHEMSGPRLIARRTEEARLAAAVIGARSVVLPLPDGYLEPTIANRLVVIRSIREIDPHIVVTNRPNDYHPDHRAVSQLVQDSAYSLVVPNIAPETPAMRWNPVILYWWDRFRLPVAFSPSVVVPIDEVIDVKVEMMSKHESQVYEWLPAVAGTLDTVPSDPARRVEWLREWLRKRSGPAADGAAAAEAFELCEYGTQIAESELASFFGIPGSIAHPDASAT